MEKGGELGREAIELNRPKVVRKDGLRSTPAERPGLPLIKGEGGQSHWSCGEAGRRCLVLG